MISRVPSRASHFRSDKFQMESVIQTGDLDGYYYNKNILAFVARLHKTGIREDSEKKAVVVVVISLDISLNLV